MLNVRDAPALPNELRVAMVTWLPVMSAGVAAPLASLRLRSLAISRSLAKIDAPDTHLATYPAK